MRFLIVCVLTLNVACQGESNWPLTEANFPEAALAYNRRASLIEMLSDDPFRVFAPEAGTSVWWVRWDVTYRSDQRYMSDFDEVLAQLGFIPLDVTRDFVERYGEPNCVRLARALVERSALRALAQHFGSHPDGSVNWESGIPISFVRPGGLHAWEKWFFGNRLNSICVRYSSANAAKSAGYSLVDVGNKHHEHVCGEIEDFQFGLFINIVAQRAPGSASLAGESISEDDADILSDLLVADELDATHHRAVRIANAVREFGRIIGLALAHEIGHALGLAHPEESISGNLMNAVVNVYSTKHAFTEDDWETLLTNIR